ncbi:glycosyltransferase family 2 protein [Rhodoferax bucti]|uniref:glycosyltransferase family 2 protein n=1 Tax=Rhodoferax bucti TaxID=2576305 RepID=UPI0011093916|nr:glycosyltransferase family 2 protein [Rhodoferax bucti]
MPTTALISIVITTYNRSDALKCVLRALEQQTDTNFEVVVADDGSTDAHVTQVQSAQQSLHFPITHVWHPDVGFTAAKVRNLGVAASAGTYLILLDGDCVPDVDFVARHRLLAEPRCFINGSRVLLTEAFTHEALSGRVDLVHQSPATWLMRRIRKQCSKWVGWMRLPDISLRRQPDFKWKGIRSCNMSLWKSDYVDINGFDETFVGWGHEDADFVLRLHNAGLTRKNGFFATEVYHLWHRESSRDMENQNAQRVRERIHSKQIQATLGYRQSLAFEGVRIHRKR